MLFILFLSLVAVCAGYFDGLLTEGVGGDFSPLDNTTEAVLLGPTLNPRAVCVIVAGVVGLELAGEGGLLVRVLIHDFVLFCVSHLF
mgnify:CR=1 FL=1